MTTPTPAALLEAALSAAALAADYLRALDRDDLGREYKSSHHDIVKPAHGYPQATEHAASPPPEAPDTNAAAIL